MIEKEYKVKGICPFCKENINSIRKNGKEKPYFSCLKCDKELGTSPISILELIQDYEQYELVLTHGFKAMKEFYYVRVC